MNTPSRNKEEGRRKKKDGGHDAAISSFFILPSALVAFSGFGYDLYRPLQAD
jgi:hypothetical protein